MTATATVELVSRECELCGLTFDGEKQKRYCSIHDGLTGDEYQMAHRAQGAVKLARVLAQAGIRANEAGRMSAGSRRMAEKLAGMDRGRSNETWLMAVAMVRALELVEEGIPTG